MTAAVKTATGVGATIGAGSSLNVAGCISGVYTVTGVTTLDWVILSDFAIVHYVHALTDADGVDAEAYVDGSTTNKVFITGTGAITLFVMGTPA